MIVDMNHAMLDFSFGCDLILHLLKPVINDLGTLRQIRIELELSYIYK